MINFKQRQLVAYLKQLLTPPSTGELKKLLPKLSILEVVFLTLSVEMAATSLFITDPPELDAVNNLILAVILATVIFFSTPFYLYTWPPRTLFVRLCVVIVLIEVVAAYIIAFAIIYRILGVVEKNGVTVYDAATCLYFSMTTWTTSGGEIAPAYEARFWAASEALLSYVVMVGAIAILSILYRSMFDKGDDEQT